MAFAISNLQLYFAKCHLNIRNIFASLWTSLSVQRHIDQLWSSCLRSCPPCFFFYQETPNKQGHRRRTAFLFCSTFHNKAPHESRNVHVNHGRTGRSTARRETLGKQRVKKVGGGAAGVASSAVRSSAQYSVA